MLLNGDIACYSFGLMQEHKDGCLTTSTAYNYILPAKLLRRSFLERYNILYDSSMKYMEDHLVVAEILCNLNCNNIIKYNENFIYKYNYNKTSLTKCVDIDVFYSNIGLFVNHMMKYNTRSIPLYALINFYAVVKYNMFVNCVSKYRIEIKEILKQYKHTMYDKYLYKEKTVRYIFDKVNRIYYHDWLLYEDFKTFLECLST